MKIETKYDIKNKLFFMKNNSVVSYNITGIQVEIGNSFFVTNEVITSVKYKFGSDEVNEDKCFTTKEELLKSL